MMRLSIPMFILLASLGISCNEGNLMTPTTHNGSSSVKIGLSMKDAPSNVASVVGILSRQGYDTLTSQFEISNDSARCEFDNVEVGPWHLEVDAYDASHNLKYTGSTNVEVIGGEISSVSLVLNAATGSILVTVSWGAGQAGNALSLDGATGYLQVPNSQSLSAPDTAITLEAWVNPADQYYNTVIAKGSTNYLLEFAGGLYLGVILEGTTLDPNAPNYWGRLMVSDEAPANQWTHIAVTYSQSSGIRVY